MGQCLGMSLEQRDLLASFRCLQARPIHGKAMAFGKRPYFHLVNFALFGGFTLWTASADVRLTPGLAALTVGQGVLVIWWLQPAAQASALLILAFLGASYLGLAYFVGASVGTPSTTRFWVIFTVTAAIFAPIVFLAWRNLRGPNESA
jgi:hypothetical protein